jgi:2-oxoglutarate dehydrogenase complex dehydrogenase (E1) component-like enzyme
MYCVIAPHWTVSPEAVNPVALGKTRAKQYSLLKTSPEDCKLGDKVMCVQLHGDASFTGQGVIMEGLGLSAYLTYILSATLPNFSDR